MRATTSSGIVLLFLALVAGYASYGLPAAAAAETPTELAEEILAVSGVRGGLVVHLGCGDGRTTVALLASEAYLVQGLESHADKVAAARQGITAQGLYGRISVDRFTGARLPYIDNLVNLLVVEDAGAVGREELFRVLAPGGALCVKKGEGWEKTIKPWPQGMDDWNQYLHDASNNAVAKDDLVGPPRHLQWVAGPNWSRHHDHMAGLSAMVSAAGRVFYIMDEGPREAILLPAQWSLIARDAFSGTILWKRPIAEWNTHLWPLKSGPNQLPRRLVAVGERVYVTLGIDAPLTALDAATGETVQTFADTEFTDELIEADGTLFVLAATEPNKWKNYHPKHTYVWSNTQRANSEWAWDTKPRKLLAIRADTGKVIWQQTTTVAPLTLAADAQSIYCYDGAKVVARDRASGALRWNSEPTVRKSPFPTGYGPTLIVQQGVVLLSIENATMTAFSAVDGKTLWQAKHHRGGHASPDDMLVVNGLVWSGAVANGADSGMFTGRDVRTGEVKSEFLPDVKTDWFHHRCYRSRASGKYFIASRTGIEFIDLEKQHWDINHWVRGGCLYGFMPSNGLLYVPQHSCGCFLESKLMGLNALAAASPTQDVPRDVSDEGRLEHGPAYGAPLKSVTTRPDDWPTYRHDAARSGAAATVIPATLKRTWQTELSGRLSAVTVAGGKVYVAAIDRHTVYALDNDTGRVVWSCTVGARVDSPPTIDDGRVIFGSADGWVYCVRADDGRMMWRYRAAPDNRRLMAYEQLESAWPVSGSVLVANGAVCCVAGRSAFLDGGMRLVRLDPKTGCKLSETVLDDRIPGTDKGLQEQIKGQDMPVALPDILSCDGCSIYMRARAFDLEGSPRETAPRKLGPFRRAAETPDDSANAEHLFSRSGFLDDSWFWRSYWILGSAVDGNYGGWLRPGHFAPCGRLIVFDDKRVFGFDRKPEYLCNASVQEYYVYGAGREVSPEALRRVQAATGRIDAASPNKGGASSDWAVRKRFSLTEQNPAAYKWAKAALPLQARGLVLAGGTLFVAGPPDVLAEEEALHNYDDPAVQAALAAQTAALRGKRGGRLLAFSTQDGTVQAAYEIGAMPVFDGMVAAAEKLFLATVDGKVICLGQAGAELPACDAAVESLDVSVSTKTEPAAEVPPAKGPSKNKDFAKVVQGQVTAAELGYHLRTDGKKMGFALQEVPASPKRVVRLKTRAKVTADGKLENLFLVFGDKPADEALVKCGLRFRLQKAMIVAGPLNGGKATEAECAADSAQVHALDVSIDLDSGEVTMQTGKTTVKATLDKKLDAVRYAGVAALDAAIYFSPVEISFGDR